MSAFGDFPEPAVRSYVITGGRARAMQPETLLVAAGSGKPLPVTASSEQRALLRLCRRLLSLVEVSAHLKLPVSVAGALAGDLADEGYIEVHASPGRARPSMSTLRQVLDGLEQLI